MNTIRDILNKHLFQGIFIGMLAILLLRTTGANAALALSCGQWNVVSSPNIPSADHFLDAVAASSANNVWTVGDYFSHTDNLYHTLTEFYC
jgi:hypothetical protein